MASDMCHVKAALLLVSVLKDKPEAKYLGFHLHQQRGLAFRIVFTHNLRLLSADTEDVTGKPSLQ